MDLFAMAYSAYSYIALSYLLRDGTAHSVDSSIKQLSRKCSTDAHKPI